MFSKVSTALALFVVFISLFLRWFVDSTPVACIKEIHTIATTGAHVMLCELCVSVTGVLRALLAEMIQFETCFLSGAAFVSSLHFYTRTSHISTLDPTS